MANYILNAVGPSGPGACKSADHGSIDIEQACTLKNCCITDATAFVGAAAFLVDYDNITLADHSDSTECDPEECLDDYQTCYTPDYENPVCGGYDNYDVYIPYGAKIRMSFYVQSKEWTYTMCRQSFDLIAKGLNPNNRGYLTTGTCLDGWFYVPGYFTCEAFRDLDYGITPLSSLTGPVDYFYPFSSATADIYYASWSNYAFDVITYASQESSNCCPDFECFDGSMITGTLIDNPDSQFFWDKFLCEYSPCPGYEEPLYSISYPVSGQLKECSAYWDYECDVPCGVRVRVVNNVYASFVSSQIGCRIYVPGDKFKVETTC
jgi:hypothetical protein